jgi:hypothetical protein
MPGSEPKDCSTGFAGRISEWNRQHPVLSIVLVSLLAVAVNCYPVVFCGKSFAASTGMAMVHDHWPPLPGMDPATPMASEHGSDTAAMLVWAVPAGFIEARSLLEDGEIPLWNRYGHAGYTFIGQAVSMLGDPLQLIVIFGHGSAGAWDAKFLAAKFLFCMGFGLLLIRILGGFLLPLLGAVFAAYCGAFFFIGNHPVFFVFCYAPWILLSAVKMLDAGTGNFSCWCPVWLLANLGCFNGGHVEPAVVLIGGLNLMALVYTSCGCRNFRAAAGITGRMAFGTLIFIGLCAPVWMSFLTSLNGSYSAHMEIKATQLLPTNLPVAFDELYYRLQVPPGKSSPVPGTSLLVLAGCILSFLRWRHSRAETFFWINTGALFLWGGCIFGWVPAGVLQSIPMLNRVGHIHTDFSYLLVIHLTIQSCYGFKSLMSAGKIRDFAADFLWLAGIFGLMLLMYLVMNATWPVPWIYLLCATAGAIGAPLLFAVLKIRCQKIPATGWFFILLLAFIPNYRFALYNFGDDKLLMLPGKRTALDAPSPAVEKIKADSSSAFRVAAMRWNFYGDYAAVYGIEDIRSCAPLSNEQFIRLVRGFPGVYFTGDWMIAISDSVAAQPLLNLLNVKYLLSPLDLEIPDGSSFHTVARADFNIVENLQAWPRAFFTDKVIPISSNEQFTKQLLQNPTRPFVAMAPDEIENEPDAKQLLDTKDAAVSSATHYLLRPNSTAFDIHAVSAGIVCLTECQAKDFTATANGESKKVLTVNLAFKGICLAKPGDYHIEFIYRPRHWRLACALFWISVCSCAIMSFVEIIRARASAGKQN